MGERQILTHNACRNPHGKKGGPAHQSKVEEAKQTLAQRNPGAKIETEVYVRTPGALKRGRFVDAAATKNGKIIDGIQVGRITKGGAPVAREVKALNDIAEQIGEGIVNFIPYN